VNFSISELIVILLVALLVIKPEQLPEVAHAIGRLAGMVRQMLSKVKDEMAGLVDTVEKTNEQQ